MTAGADAVGDAGSAAGSAGSAGSAPDATPGHAADAGVESAPTAASGPVRIYQGDNLRVIRGFADASFTLIYLDPPFNTGRARQRSARRARRSSPPTGAGAQETQRSSTTTGARAQETLAGAAADAAESRGTDGAVGASSLNACTPDGDRGERQSGFRGRSYPRSREGIHAYDDSFDDYQAFLLPRLEEARRLLTDDGTLYLHLDYREAHYAKVMLDGVFGRDCFLNELVWAYDYGAKSRRRWPSKHDTILVYVKDPDRYWFDSSAVDRVPYMAPGLVTPEKAVRGKLPTDVWWHTIVPTSGSERTGYPTQKPEGILRRIVAASSRPGDRVLDFFAGSGTTGAVASALGRDVVLVDNSPEAIAVMQRRMPHATLAPTP